MEVIHLQMTKTLIELEVFYKKNSAEQRAAEEPADPTTNCTANCTAHCTTNCCYMPLVVCSLRCWSEVAVLSYPSPAVFTGCLDELVLEV